MSSYQTLRLILGDQLNASHSWYRSKDANVLYVIAELAQEMNGFAKGLEKAGHNVLHLTLDETAQYSTLQDLLRALSDKYQINNFEYQRPDEYRLLTQLEQMQLANVSIKRVETEHFVVPFDEISEHFSTGKSMRMETFYRKMRVRFNILMQGDANDRQPLGGQWNYDADNRQKLKKQDLVDIPAPIVFDNPVTDIVARLDRHNISSFGQLPDSLVWPINRQQSLEVLDYFCRFCLPQFGRFQDAMTANSPHAWSLYHSRLSFSLNSKMISPMQVIERAVQEYQLRQNEISLAQIEGFVRQILGWREFIRGIYWANMPSYATGNALGAQMDLPNYFWSGETNMRCMQHSLGQSLEFAYAHHIQRLMVIGNFCLLAGIDPDQVDQWYLGVYIDAIEWVEMPNTRGMCQFADGGLVASKPYTASGAYINRMSDYCSACHYNVKQKVGEQACPFNSLYWHFMHRHRDKFGKNPRIGMVYRNLDKMDDQTKQQTLKRGQWLLDNINAL